MNSFISFKNKKTMFTQSTEVFTVKPESNSTLDVQSNATDDRKTCRMSTRRILWHACFDVPALISLFLVIGLYEAGVIPSHKWGFFCDDRSLDYQFTGDTVSALMLMSVVLVVPSKVIMITEYFLYKRPDYVLKETFKKKLFRLMRIKWLLTKDYLYGLLINLAIVEVMKGVTGMPRPTFFELCKPDALANCANITGSKFICDFTCTSSYYWWYQLDASRSFPSGHASLSIHAGFFTVWYLQRRAFSWSSKPMLLVPLVQLACVAFAAVASLTRITDHRHHWWDVLVGAVIGFSTVWYTCMILCNNFTSLEGNWNLSNNKDSLIKKSRERVEDTRVVVSAEN